MVQQTPLKTTAGGHRDPDGMADLAKAEVSVHASTTYLAADGGADPQTAICAAVDGLGPCSHPGIILTGTYQGLTGSGHQSGPWLAPSALQFRAYAFGASPGSGPVATG